MPKIRGSQSLFPKGFEISFPNCTLKTLPWMVTGMNFIWSGPWCTSLMTHALSTTHTHTHWSASLALSVKPGSHFISLLLSCPGTPTPEAAVLHLALVVYGEESGHTLWLTLPTKHTLHLWLHNWASSLYAPPHLSYDTTTHFIPVEKNICWCYDIRLPSINSMQKQV